jgi:type III restriction enzyme
MNTVGKPGQLGASIRCVVSVSMLTEGWDANTVTHVLGIRAFGTQLLCEQVIGRALRRQSYELNEDRGSSTSSTPTSSASPSTSPRSRSSPRPRPPRHVQVKAVRPERDALEIRFPRVEGYRVELPEERLEAHFNDDSVLVLSPDLVGPSKTREQRDHRRRRRPRLEHLKRHAHLDRVFHLTQHLLYTKWRDAGEEPKLHLFGQLKRITRQWLDTCLECKGGTYPAQLMYQDLADMACDDHRRHHRTSFHGERPDQGAARSLQPDGLHGPRPLQHLEGAPLGTARRPLPRQLGVLDSDWEAEFCRVVESHPKVRAYVKNQGLGFEVPYRTAPRTEVPARLHRARRRRPRPGRPAAPRRRDQGLPRRRRKEKKADDGDLLGARREPPRHLRPLGLRRVHARSTRSSPTSKAKVASQFDELIASAALRTPDEEEA